MPEQMSMNMKSTDALCDSELVVDKSTFAHVIKTRMGVGKAKKKSEYGL